jgi:large subunit ribosomal protein L6
MSRVANSPIDLPAGVEVILAGQDVRVKGKLGEMSWTIHDKVSLTQEDSTLKLDYVFEDKDARALAGTTRALIANMVSGVSEGFEKKLTLVGVGYRAQVAGKSINLSLGFSHPVAVQLPEGITAEAPSQTELTIKGIDKQAVNQVAANIRSLRPPEPYKGKGVRYTGEVINMKEGKKK